MARGGEESALSALERGVVELFSDGARLLGVPRSVGEIYGLLYMQREGLSLDDLVERLGVSKGTGSQGLKMLRTLGAVKEVASEASRKTFYTADVELKSLVGGFIREEVRPHLKSAEQKVAGLEGLVNEGDSFEVARIERLNKWRKKAGVLLPVLQKILSS